MDMLRAAVLVLALAAAPVADACTLCHSADARLLRHQVMEHGFWENLLSISAVLPILIGVIYVAGMDQSAGKPRIVNERG
jgi:hypothetical protein